MLNKSNKKYSCYAAKLYPHAACERTKSRTRSDD